MSDMPNILGSAVGTTCPICDAEITARCKCPRSDSFCPNGHQWHTCTVHKVYVEGHSDHSTDTFTCTCGDGEHHGDGDNDAHADCDGKSVVDYEVRARKMLIEEFDAMSAAESPLAVVKLAILLEKADRADAKSDSGDISDDAIQAVRDLDLLPGGRWDRVTRIIYTNHKGKTSDRRIVPDTLWFGETEYHPGNQWLLKAFDLDKNAYRDFALKDIKEWKGDMSCR